MSDSATESSLSSSSLARNQKEHDGSLDNAPPFEPQTDRRFSGDFHQLWPIFTSHLEVAVQNNPAFKEIDAQFGKIAAKCLCLIRTTSAWHIERTAQVSHFSIGRSQVLIPPSDTTITGARSPLLRSCALGAGGDVLMSMTFSLSSLSFPARSSTLLRAHVMSRSASQTRSVVRTRTHSLRRLGPTAALLETTGSLTRIPYSSATEEMMGHSYR